MKQIIFLLFFPLLLNAGIYPERPANYVNDPVNVLTTDQEVSLNKKLKKFEDSTSNQIFVLIASSLEGEEITSLSQEIFHSWRIGSKGKNNGLLIAVFVKDHKFRIHTGYGLEGTLPDLLTKKIQDEFMRPHFKAGNYYEGIDAGVDQLIYYSQHEYKAEEKNEFQLIADFFGSTTSYIINAFFLFSLIWFIFRKDKKQRTPTFKTMIITVGVLAALLPCIGAVIIFIMLGFLNGKKKYFSRSRGTYGSSSSDYSWGSSDSSYDSSSSSDSGFDGGGGGDSGGGGSSSDW